jgi:iron complex outermembrane receptor protein
VDETPADGDNLTMPIISVFTNIGPNHLGVSGIPAHARGVESDYFSQEFLLESTGDKVDWTAGAYYQDFNEDLKNNTALLIIDSFNPAFGNGANVGGTPIPNDEYVLSNNHQDNPFSVTTLAVFADATIHVTDRLDLFGGIRWTDEELDSTLNNLTQLAPLTFAEIAARFDSSTKTLRVDDLPVFPIGFTPLAVGSSSTSESFVSYRLGGSYAVSDNVNAYASVSRGQVGVGKNNSYSGTTDAFLKPTVADSYEIGLKGQFADDRLRLNIALFTQDVEDLQASALDPGTVNTRTINAGDTQVNGLEADALFAINDNWAISASLVALDHEIKNLLQACYIDQLLVGTGCTIDQSGDGIPETQDVSGKPTTNTPDLKYNIGLSADFPTRNLPFDFFGYLNYTWQDDIQFTLNQDDLATQSSYGILDLTLGLADKDGRYEFQLYGKNLTDESFVADAFEAFGALGRRVIRVPRNAQTYWGARVKVNF